MFREKYFKLRFIINDSTELHVDTAGTRRWMLNRFMSNYTGLRFPRLSHTILCDSIHVCMHITLCIFCVLMVCPGRQICPLRLHHRFLILLKVFSLGKFFLTGIEGLRTEGVTHRTDCEALWRLCNLWLSAHKLNLFELNWTLLKIVFPWNKFRTRK